MVDNCVPRQQLGSCRPFLSLWKVWLARLACCHVVQENQCTRERMWWNQICSMIIPPGSHTLCNLDLRLHSTRNRNKSHMHINQHSMCHADTLTNQLTKPHPSQSGCSLQDNQLTSIRIESPCSSGVSCCISCSFCNKSLAELTISCYLWFVLTCVNRSWSIATCLSRACGKLTT